MPVDEMYYDENTLFKVSASLKKLGVLTEQQIIDAITEMQNAGIFFREKLSRRESKIVGQAIDFMPSARPSKFVPGGEFQPQPTTYIHWAYETKD